MTIRQFNVTYSADEDRMLLRAILTNNEEYRFWLTRASLKPFFQFIEQWLQPANSLPAEAVKAFHREASVAGADFQTPLKPGEIFPIGETPVLVRKIDVQTEPGSPAVRLILKIPENRLATFNIDEQVLASLNALLQKAVRGTDWGLVSGGINPSVVEGPGGGLLH